MWSCTQSAQMEQLLCNESWKNRYTFSPHASRMSWSCCARVCVYGGMFCIYKYRFWQLDFVHIAASIHRATEISEPFAQLTSIMMYGRVCVVLGTKSERISEDGKNNATESKRYNRVAERIGSKNSESAAANYTLRGICWQCNWIRRQSVRLLSKSNWHLFEMIL